MFKEFLLALKLARYGLQFKMQVTMAALFFVVGIIIEIVTKGSSYLGGFYIFLCTMFVFQLIVSMDVSTLIQSSAMKRNFQIKYPYIASVPIMFTVYTAVVIFHFIHGATADADTLAKQCKVIVTLGIAFFGTIIYLGITYKYMVVGSVVFCLVMIPFLSIAQADYGPINEFFNIGLVPATIVGYAFVIAGFVISNLLMKAFYKKDISEWAFKNALGKEYKRN